MINIRMVTGDDLRPLSLPDEPFTMPGRLCVELKNGMWTCREELFEDLCRGAG